jgi:GAF domain-containing protein
MPGGAGDGLILNEQAALRRVATLVARAVAPEEVLAAIAEEAGRLLHADCAAMKRYEPDDEITVAATWSSTGAAFPLGIRAKLGGWNVPTLIFQTGIGLGGTDQHRQARSRHRCRNPGGGK